MCYLLAGRDIGEGCEIISDTSQACQYLSERRNDEIFSMAAKTQYNVSN